MPLNPLSRTLARLVAGTAAILACGCESQRSFRNPEAAVASLGQALAAGDRAELSRLFGPRAKELRSADPEQDRQDLASFRRNLEAGSVIETQGDDRATVLVGEDRWPFAVPLVRQGSSWKFDTDAGIDEMTSRRIGRNELRTIAACRTLIDAQAQYHSLDRDGDGVLEYARRLNSTPGSRDGLYWPPAPGGADPSPIGPVLAAAASRRDADGDPLPFHGYFYRLLTAQGPGAPGGERDYSIGGKLTGGWAVIAWPADYGETGIMSFIAGDGGAVYERDLGPESAAVAESITRFDPADGWNPVTSPEPTN